jgi:alpha-tubulin suppressor-like RCC1 family protein
VILERGVVDLAAGGSFSLALLEDGTLRSWGKNYDGHLGIGDKDHRTIPTLIDFWKVKEDEKGKVEGGEKGGKKPYPKIVSLGCGCDHSFALTYEGDLFVWGSGYEGKLGLGHEQCYSVELPVCIPGVKFRRPRNFYDEFWGPVFQWLFLSRVDLNSEISFPVEVLYHFVVILINIKY